ncbi:MAG TPA: hypothetical protein VFC78_17895 [Tepidisphaeraceae bacterium]|nr:hypothetical protein [Tepidisphaeraceae bacterium]
MTAFPSSSWEAPASLWRDVLGDDPDNEAYERAPQLRVQSRQWQGGTLNLTASPLSVVWQAGPGATEDGTPAAEQMPVEGVVEQFYEFTRRWLVATDMPIKRIGFGLHSVLPANDRAAAYRLLADLVPSVNIDPDVSSDLAYQINRFTESRSLAGLRLNRLMKWSAPGFRQVQIQLGVQGSPQVTTGRIFAGLDNDLNTAAEHTEPLDHEALGAIYDELIDLAWDNLRFGELGREA